MRRWTGAATLGVALSIAAPSSADAATIRPVGKLPLVAPAGGSLEVTLQIGAATGLPRVGLVLGGSPKGGTRLGGAGALARTKSARVRVRGGVPRTVKAGQRLTLFACVNASAAVKTGTGCKALGSVPTSGPSLQERLDAAVAAKRLTRGQALVYGLYAINKDPRLPLELRAGSAGAGGGERLLRDAAVSADTLPRSLLKQLVWYFVPPAGPGSAWPVATPKGGTSRATAGAAAAQANCVGFNALSDSPYTGAFRAKWVGVPTTDGKAIVWYQEGDTRAQASARAFARYMPEIWAKLTREFKEPQSDASASCFHGPDGRFDIYVDDLVPILAAGGLNSAAARATSAATSPYPAARGRWCTNRPAWIAIDSRESRWVLAHEFMHAIQLSYTYASCGGVAWWDEGGANWAADFVYPDDNLQQQRWPEWVANPLAQGSISSHGYEAWPLWMMLQRTLGTDVLRQIFARLGSAPSVQAVNAAVPGGLARQWPRFAASVWNQPPVGTAGFELDQSFKAWDSFAATPAGTATMPLELGGLSERTIDLTPQNPQRGPLTIASYHRVPIPDEKVKEVHFKPGGGSVLAMLKLADGTSKLEDWTGREVTLCRSKAEENVQELVIVTANASTNASLPDFTHELRARNVCKRPTYSGTFSGRATYTEAAFGPGSDVLATWNGNVTFEPVQTDRIVDRSIYKITGGTVNYQLSGGDSECRYSGTKTFDLPGLDFGTASDGTLQILPGSPDRYALGVGLPLSQSFTATRSSCATPSQNGPFLWLISAGIPGMLATGPLTAAGPPFLAVPDTGVLAGTAGGGTPGPADTAAMTWTWNLTPRD